MSLFSLLLLTSVNQGITIPVSLSNTPNELLPLPVLSSGISETVTLVYNYNTMQVAEEIHGYTYSNFEQGILNEFKVSVNHNNNMKHQESVFFQRKIYDQEYSWYAISKNNQWNCENGTRYTMPFPARFSDKNFLSACMYGGQDNEGFVGTWKFVCIGDQFTKNIWFLQNPEVTLVKIAYYVKNSLSQFPAAITHYLNTIPLGETSFSEYIPSPSMGCDIPEFVVNYDYQTEQANDDDDIQLNIK